MDIFVYNQMLETVGIIDKYTSLNWTRKYNECGTFEIECPMNSLNFNLLAPENIISQSGSDEAGFIYYRKINHDDEGNEKLNVKGLFLEGYLNRRIVWGSTILKEETTEVVIRTIVDENCINPTDTDRVIDNLALGDLVGFTDSIEYDMAYGNLLDEIQTLCTSADLGFRIVFDEANKALIFEVYQGIDRSSSQSNNPRCVFSRQYDNIINQEYSDSTSNYKNLCLVGGKSDDDDTDRVFVTLGEGTGLDRREVFCDQGGLSNYEGSTQMTATEYKDLLTTKGESILAAMVEVESFDSEINLKSNLVYKEDFDIGDIVTVLNNDWGIMIETRIMEIEEVYEEEGLTLNIIFGDDVPTLIEIIKQGG